jgi:uncharacterized protein YyaL (SSP411 family)
MEHVEKHFAHPEVGFYLTPDTVEAPMGKQFDLFDSARPSGNSVMVQNYLSASALTGKTEYHEAAAKALRGFSGAMGNSGLGMAWMFDAAEKFMGPFYGVVIVGAPGDVRTQGLLTAFRMADPAHAVLVPVDPGEERVAMLPVPGGKLEARQEPVAHVCEFGACRLPTSDPDEMLSQIFRGWVH